MSDKHAATHTPDKQAEIAQLRRLAAETTLRVARAWASLLAAANPKLPPESIEGES